MTYRDGIYRWDLKCDIQSLLIHRYQPQTASSIYDAISVLPFSICAIKINPEYSLDRIVAEGEAPILLPPDAKS